MMERDGGATETVGNYHGSYDTGTFAESVITADTELRFLPGRARSLLVNLLDVGDGWKKVLYLITHPDDPHRKLFNTDHAWVLENETRRSRTDEILKTWSTTGRNRPKIRDLVRLLKEAELYRAASIIATDVLQEAPLDEDDVSVQDLIDQLDMLPTAPPLSVTDSAPDVNSTESSDPLEIPYAILVRATRNFSSKIGEGAFGVVYKGTLPDGTTVAVKCLKESFPNKFLSEVELLRRLSHPNLLPLVGVANDSRHCCIVYKFMEYGSLQSCLARENDAPPMFWEKRISILTEVSAAINFLHTRTPDPLIHRDVKSANVLLDEHWSAKLGDFGLTRVLSGNATTVTEAVGTTVYMAPEAFRGVVSPKMDTYSFGVVIMEILTGLPLYIARRGHTEDILSYLSEEHPDDIVPALDQSAGEWNVELAKKVYELGEKCIDPDKRKRPTMQPVYERILELHDIMFALPAC